MPGGTLLVVVTVILATGNMPALAGRISANMFALRYLTCVHTGCSGGMAYMTTEANSFDADRDEVARIVGMAQLALADYRHAVVYLSRASASGRDPIASYWLGKAFESSGDYAQALAAMHDAGNDNYFPALPSTMSRTDIQDLACTGATDEMSALARFELAKLAYAGDPECAHRLFEQAFRLTPENLKFSLDSARFLFDNGDLAGAEVFSRRAKIVSPDSPWANILVGQLQRATGDLNGAEATFDRVSQIAAGSYVGNVAHIELAGLYNSRRQFQAAIEHLKLALAFDSTQLAAHLNLARSYAGLGRCAAALDELTIAERLVDSPHASSSYKYTEDITRKSCAQ